MNNKLIVGSVIALFGFVGAYFMWPGASEAPSTEENKVVEKTVNEKVAPAPAAAPTPKTTTTKPKTTTSPIKTAGGGGSFEVYSPEKLTRAGRVVLFFSSASCATCAALEANVRANVGAIPKDVSILKVDLDTNPELKARFGIQSPHIFIQVDRAGQHVTQWSGSMTLLDMLPRIVKI